MYLASTSWLLITLLLAGLALIAIWSRRPTRARLWAVVVLLLAAPVAAFAVMLPLGLGVPMITGLTIPPGKHPVLGVKMVFGEGIFVMLDLGENREPRLYRLPWEQKMSQDLQEMMEEGSQDGSNDMEAEAPPFEFSWNTKPMFYDNPQPMILPPKPRQPDTPVLEQDI